MQVCPGPPQLSELRGRKAEVVMDRVGMASLLMAEHLVDLRGVWRGGAPSALWG